MSEEKVAEGAPAEAAEGEEKAKKGPNKLLLPLIVLLMTAAGGAVGMMVVAPTLVAREHKAAGLEAEPAEGGEGGEEHGGGGEHGEGGGEKGPMFKIDNLIVNPAGSQGSRFLMVSVAVETPDAKLEEHLRAREAQIRDVVIAMIETLTMDNLSQPGIRDSLKTVLSDTISTIAGSKAKLRVFLPQFVIQ
ncbi:MAG: flagellar basal body-associated FliL family protein [Gemmatimonadales bacterium]|nr:flagellar basal body-associated FliL family protein [Gemmatimonadales bacterium]